MLEDSLSRTEWTWYEPRTALHDGVEGVDGTHAGLKQLEWTRLFDIVGHGELNGPMLHHVYLDHAAVLSLEVCYGIVYPVLSHWCDVLDGCDSPQLERSHYLQGLVVLLHLSEPVALPYLVPHAHDGFEIPFPVCVERFGILPPLEEHPFHLVEVILEAIKVLAEHSRSKLYLKHVSGKLGLGADLEASGALEHLHVHVHSNDLDDLCHQTVAACHNIANLSL